MVKKALVVLAEGFEEIEAVSAVDILRRGGIEVVVAGLSDTKVKGSRGVMVLADKKFDEIEPDFDAVVFPGGMPGAANLAASGKVASLVKAMHEEGKVIAAICAAPALVLVPTGILKGRAATCYPGMQENFRKETAYKEAPVVVDGNIITSRGPATALEFALAVVEKLLGKEAGDKIRKATLAG